MLTCRGETIGYREKNDAVFDREYSTGLCHGACMMISRMAIDKVGVLHEGYFMYYEEYDYCERVKRAGFDIYYNGQSSILHKESVSVGKDSPFKSYYMTRNRIYFSRRNFTGLNLLSSLVYNYAIAVPKNILKEFVMGRRANSIAIARGSAWNLFHKA